MLGTHLTHASCFYPVFVWIDGERVSNAGESLSCPIGSWLNIQNGCILYTKVDTQLKELLWYYGSWLR